MYFAAAAAGYVMRVLNPLLFRKLYALHVRVQGAESGIKTWFASIWKPARCGVTVVSSGLGQA